MLWPLQWDIWKVRDPKSLSTCDGACWVHGPQNQAVCVLFTQELVQVRHQDPSEKKTAFHICVCIPPAVLRTQQDHGTAAELRNE